MKKAVFLSAIALLIGMSISAQTNTQVRTENKAAVQAQSRVQNQDQVQAQTMTAEQLKEQARIQKQLAKEEKKQARIKARNEKAAHGEAVSETAKKTESGPGKGETVSTQAKTKSAVKQAKPANDGKAVRNKAAKGATVKTGKGKMPVGR